MNKKIKSSLFAMLLVFGFSTAAVSEGLNIGLQFHTMGFYGVGEEFPDNTKTAKKDRKEAGAFTDEVFSIFAEYDAGPISVGIGYIPETIASPENKNVQRTSAAPGTDITNTAKVDINDIMTIYALVDLYKGSYVKLGYREATVETKENLGTGGSYNDVDVDGYSVALGLDNDYSNFGMGVRSKRFALIADNRTVTNLMIEEPGQIDVSKADSILSKL